MKRVFFGLVVLTFITAISAPASAQTPADDVMAKAEHFVEAFLDQFSEVKCTENVEQAKLTKGGKAEYKEQSQYDYLLIAQNNGGELTLDESRLEEHAAQHKKNISLLVTNGFATQLLVFHPYYVHAYEFSPPEWDTLNGRQVAKIRFRHIKGMRTQTALMLRGREYPLDMMGIAWVDKDSGAVVKMETELESSLEDLGLKGLQSEVVYSPIQFKGTKEVSWLPTQATIEVETPKQHWRNTHRFSNYQRFDVDTHSQDKIPDSLKASR